MAVDNTKILADWQAKAASLSFETRAFINGEFVAAVAGSTLTSINPATGSVLAEVASCDALDAERATQAARATLKVVSGHVATRVSASECYCAWPIW